ncbi:hypothetical protein HYDPIDRAFT_130638 [Hydnomerulius pinastri MD-312]|nr:hypothetical protein HYDPIDRAFT_130638 [Hydnomerulius pinastri MD-312]
MSNLPVFGLVDERSLPNVTPETLATHCGILGDQSNVTEEHRILWTIYQLDILFSKPHAHRDSVFSQFSAKYLPSLVAAYKKNTTPGSSITFMMNVISHLPYFVRYQRTPEASDLVVLQATWMANAPPGEPSDLRVITEMCQFLSTLLSLQGSRALSGDVVGKLLHKLQSWMDSYPDSFASETSYRCFAILTGLDDVEEIVMMFKDGLEQPLMNCGARGCNRHIDYDEVKQCSRCKSVVYCGAPHQAQHWPEHKKFCFPAVF